MGTLGLQLHPLLGPLLQPEGPQQPEEPQPPGWLENTIIKRGFSLKLSIAKICFYLTNATPSLKNCCKYSLEN